MVGFMSSEVREAGERVRVALKNVGIPLPAARITVNLAPADIPKRGIVIDLPVAVGELICMEMLRQAAKDYRERFLRLVEDQQHILNAETGLFE